MDIVENSQMDKLDYPALLKNILSRHVELCNRRPNQDVENFLVIDENSHNGVAQMKDE